MFERSRCLHTGNPAPDGLVTLDILGHGMTDKQAILKIDTGSRFAKFPPSLAMKAGI
jgi:hypothetical protein